MDEDEDGSGVQEDETAVAGESTSRGGDKDRGQDGDVTPGDQLRRGRSTFFAAGDPESGLAGHESESYRTYDDDAREDDDGGDEEEDRRGSAKQEDNEGCDEESGGSIDMEGMGTPAYGGESGGEGEGEGDVGAGGVEGASGATFVFPEPDSNDTGGLATVKDRGEDGVRGGVSVRAGGIDAGRGGLKRGRGGDDGIRVRR